MRVWKSEAEFDLEACVVALGTFDGVHRGHQALIHRAIEMGRELGLPAVVYTFDRHPLALLCPERAPEPLLSREEKLDKLQAMGVQGVLMQPFSREFAAVDPVDFLEGLAKRLRVKGIVAGFNYSFGAGGRGDAALIRAWSERLGYRAEIVPAVTDGQDVVSSTLLRGLREKGDMQRFERLLKLGEAR